MAQGTGLGNARAATRAPDHAHEHALVQYNMRGSLTDNINAVTS